MDMMLDGLYDVVVIGGGLGGSMVVVMLVWCGYCVVVLEKVYYLCFYIGELLLLMNLLLFECFGVLEQVQVLGVFKFGVDFEVDNESGYNIYVFDCVIGDSFLYVYQVWWQDFDKMLFEYVVCCGVQICEGYEVVGVEQLGLCESWFEVKVDDGCCYQLLVCYVIDVSGCDVLLVIWCWLWCKNVRYQSVVIFGYFCGVICCVGVDVGNISIYIFVYGWMWMILLFDGVMSVGVVCWLVYFKQCKGLLLVFLLEMLKLNLVLWQCLEYVELIDQEVCVIGNYFYDVMQMGGLGWVMVGDVFVFFDLVFFFGVYLVMSGVEQVVEMVDQVLCELFCEWVLLC